MAEPERGHSEGAHFLPEDSPEEVGSATASFCRQGASWSNQMKTRREGRSPLMSGSIVILDRAW